MQAMTSTLSASFVSYTYTYAHVCSRMLTYAHVCALRLVREVNIEPVNSARAALMP
jgi:hypothetical protein